MNTTMLKLENDIWMPNRDIDTDSLDWKGLALYYKACGYKNKTIRTLIHHLYEEVTDKQMIDLIMNFEKRTGSKFRAERSSVRRCKEWKDFYLDVDRKGLGKSYSNDFEFTPNRPLDAGDREKFMGIKKSEKKLLAKIRSKK